MNLFSWKNIHIVASFSEKKRGIKTFLFIATLNIIQAKITSLHEIVLRSLKNVRTLFCIKLRNIDD